jgi:hypothetical protein
MILPLNKKSSKAEEGPSSKPKLAEYKKIPFQRRMLSLWYKKKRHINKRVKA